ncbi:MAG: WbqC family protein [Planctomycetota bacterium]
MTTCVISQPRFFPGLHYLDRMVQADVFVIFDTVQFTPRHEENRAKLKTRDGTQWLSVPVQKLGRDMRIVDTMPSPDQPWQDAAIKTLAHLYGKAPHYAAHKDEVEAILRAPHRNLTELDRASWAPALRLCGIDCEFVLASELPVEGRGPELLLAICRHLGADVYLSGGFGREYLEPDTFAAAGVEVRYHEFEYPTYPQRFGEFTPFLSYLDALFCTGLRRDELAWPASSSQ